MCNKDQSSGRTHPGLDGDLRDTDPEGAKPQNANPPGSELQGTVTFQAADTGDGYQTPQPGPENPHPAEHKSTDTLWP